MEGVKGGTVMKKIPVKRLAVHSKSVRVTPVIFPEPIQLQLTSLSALPKQSPVAPIQAVLQDCSKATSLDAQHAVLKKLGSTVPKLNVKELSEEDRKTFIEVLQIAIRLLFVPEAEEIFSPILFLLKAITRLPRQQPIDELSLYGICLRLLGAELEVYMSTLLVGDEQPQPSSFPLAGKMTIMTALFELDEMVFQCLSSSPDDSAFLKLFQFFFEYLQQYLHAFLSSGISDVSREGHTDNTDGGGTTNSNLRSTHRGEMALKALLLAQTRFAALFVKKFSEAFFSSSSSTPSSSTLSLIRTVGAINQTLLAILHHMSPHRDIIGPAALGICGFIKLKLVAEVQAKHGEPTFPYEEMVFPTDLLQSFQKEIMHTFFPDSIAPEQGRVSSFDILLNATDSDGKTIAVPYYTHATLAEHYLRFPLNTHLAVVKALVVSLPVDVLAVPFSIVKPGTQDGTKVTLLWDYLSLTSVRQCSLIVEPLSRRFTFGTVTETIKATKKILLARISSDKFDFFGSSAVEFFEDFQRRFLDIIWTNWSDPSDLIVAQVGNMFELLLDIYYILLPSLSAANAAGAFVGELADHLLQVENHRKSKYVALEMVINRMGATEMAKIRSDFVYQLMMPLKEPTSRNAAGKLLDAFLVSLKEETKKTLGGAKEAELVAAACREIWCPTVVDTLFTGDKLTQQGLITYGLPSILSVFPTELEPLLSAVYHKSFLLKEMGQEGGGSEYVPSARTLRAIISVLKTARKSGLIESAGLETCLDRISIPVDSASLRSFPSILRMSITADDEDLRCDALELISSSKKTVEAPTPFELDMVKAYLQTNIKCASPSLRNSISPWLGKFLCRIRGYRPPQKKLTEKQVEECNKIQNAITTFQEWLLAYLVGAMYPGAPFQRKMTALKLYTEFLDSLSDVKGPQNATVLDVHSPEMASVLVLSLWDEIDSMRQLPFAVLGRFPSPLPSFKESSLFAQLLSWGIFMLFSPRAREVDTGSLVCRLALAKYIIPLKWRVNVILSGESHEFPIVIAYAPEHPKYLEIARSNVTPTQQFFWLLYDVLDKHIAIASVDLFKASQQAPMHGPLLAVRYLLQAVDFKAVTDETEIAKWRELLEGLLDRLKQVDDIALSLVSAASPEGYTSAEVVPEFEGGGGGDSFGGDDDEGAGGASFAGPHGQLLAVCAWLSIKEVALLLGSIINSVPLPLPNQQHVILTEHSVERAGDQFLHILLTSRHRGAIEKSHMGFQVLCENLLASANPNMYNLPHKWLQVLIDSIAKDHIKSVTRRSAGLPYAFSSILRAEAVVSCRRKSAATVLIDKAMKFLLQTASDFVYGKAVKEAGAYREEASVHALNVLRMLSRDAALKLAVIPYLPDALMLAIEGYTSSSWAIRNSSTMNFSVIVERVVAPKLVRDEHSKRNSATFIQFFARFPQLYPFLLDKLRQQLQYFASDAEKSKEEKSVLYSNLFPILVLLAKLRPFPVKKNHKKAVASEEFNPEAFIPFVTDCAAQQNFKVRQMAAKALVPLVSGDKLKDMILSLYDTAVAKTTPTNKAHGCLLQVHYLLMSFEKKKSQLHREVVDGLVEKIMKDDLRLLTETQCGAVQSEFTEILQLLLTSSDSLPSFLFTRLDSLFSSSSAQKGVRVMNAKYRRELAFLYLQCTTIKGVTSKEATEIVLRLLNDKDYEARLCLLKFVRRSLNNGTLSMVSWEEFQGQLVEHVMGWESHYAALKHSLQLLRRLPIPLPRKLLHSTAEGSDASSQPSFWIRLVQLLEGPHSASVKEEVICLMGLYLGELCTRIEKEIEASTLEAMLTHYAKYCTIYSAPEQPYTYRLAVATSISLSGICSLSARGRESEGKASSVFLSQWKEFEGLSLSLWNIVISLLEDDDDSVRKEAAQLVSVILQHNNNCLASPYAFDMSFQYLTKNYGGSMGYLTLLLGWMGVEDSISTSSLKEAYDPKAVVPIPAFEFLGESWGDYGNKLFEKEADNWYEEKVLLIQAAATQFSHVVGEHLKAEEKLGDIGDSVVLKDEKQSLRAKIHFWQRYYLLKLGHVLQWLVARQDGKLAWARWLTFQKQVFLTIFQFASILLALSQAAPLDSYDTEVLQDTLPKLASLHPLLQHLFASLLPQLKLNSESDKLLRMSAFFLEGSSLLSNNN